MSRIYKFSMLILMLIGLGFIEVVAQVQPAESVLRGKIMDPNGACVSSARLSARASRGSGSFTALTDGAGEFLIRLTPGEYLVDVTADGFSEASQSVTVKEGASQTIQIVLQVAGYSGTVTVTDMSGYQTTAISSATRTFTPLRDVPQSITVMTREVIDDQSMQSVGDVVRYIPGITAIQGENNRDQVVIRGNSSSADFFLDGLRDDVQYYRDLYNLERLEALKGPNAMIFGRGGGGGVINRVTKQASFASSRAFTFQGGSFGNKRVTGDVDQGLGRVVAFRVNGIYENSRSFRDRVGLERYGINPTFTFVLPKQTQIRVAYEHFRDNRVADRGIPSYQGRPSNTPISTFFGNPDESKVRAAVNILSATIEHQAGNLNIRNRTLFGDYDRFYQNFVPGKVNAAGTLVSLSAYNNATRRRNLFNQTDLTYSRKLLSVKHTFLAGAEFGRQVSNNLRNSGFFNNTSTSIFVPFDHPTIDTPVTFRQSTTDADNRVVANIGATYAQDQIQFSKKIQVLAGVRFDHFDLSFHNHRNGDTLQRIDNLLSPRAGIVFKPVDPLSLYGSYSVSYLPSSGDQFSSLTSVTQTLKPEKFQNYEFGAKWHVRASLSLTAAAYRLDRTNTRATDPNDPTRLVQTGAQRTNGFELGAEGNVTRDWKIVGGYAYQDAYVRSATSAAPKGARVAQVPRNTLSLWNNYRFPFRLGAGLGIIHRSDMYAAIDNTVVLPGYTRVDAAVYYTISERLGLQANFENVLDKKYFVNADGNDNISPGYPRAVRLNLAWRF